MEASLPPAERIYTAEIQQCWTRWKHHDDEQALGRLLKYNEEDVMNLVRLRELLGV
ncbi:MAG: ribonuclease H-like domain-containing protein [Thermoleophilia bacterium]